MLTAALLMASAVVSAGSQDRNGTVADRLAAAIVDKGYKRVGVVPRFIARKAGGEALLGGPIGPSAERYAEDIEDALAKMAGGRFQVVPGRVLKKAFKGLKLDDLGDMEALAKVSGRVEGLDALVVGNVVDERDADADGKVGGLNVRCELVGVKDGSLAGSAREKVEPTLSDGACMGESWELRRWTEGGLKATGLAERVEDGPSVSPFGAGAAYEQFQYKQIIPDRPHPLLDPEFPYRVDVLVGNEVREPVKVGKLLYVPLEPGEVYKIRVKNMGPRKVYASVFVDGINILGKKRETPDPETCRYWSLKERTEGVFRGWYAGEGGKVMEEEFSIEPADDTVAVGQGFSQNLGLITTVIYTVGMTDVPPASKLKAAIVGGTFGTGSSGKSRPVELEMQAGDKPGLILAAVSLRYVTASQLKVMQAPVAKDR